MRRKAHCLLAPRHPVGFVSRVPPHRLALFGSLRSVVGLRVVVLHREMAVNFRNSLKEDDGSGTGLETRWARAPARVGLADLS
jgi:hypothetical protein